MSGKNITIGSGAEAIVLQLDHEGGIMLLRISQAEQEDEIIVRFDEIDDLIAALQTLRGGAR
jgi:hypothetical protein